MHVAQDVRAKRIDRRHAKLPKFVHRLLFEDIERAMDAIFTIRAKAVECGSSRQYAVCAERKCLEHVRAVADTARHQQRHAIANDLAGLAKHIERGDRPVHLPTTMAAEDDPVHAMIEGLSNIVRVENSLDEEGAFPAIADFRDVIP